MYDIISNGWTRTQNKDYDLCQPVDENGDTHNPELKYLAYELRESIKTLLAGPDIADPDNMLENVDNALYYQKAAENLIDVFMQFSDCVNDEDDSIEEPYHGFDKETIESLVEGTRDAITMVSLMNRAFSNYEVMTIGNTVNIRMDQNDYEALRDIVESYNDDDEI